jgi:hypothetical protein
VTSSVDLSPPRRPIFFPVVIATVFLTIIGMAGGFVLGERHRQTNRVAQQTSSQQQAPAPATTESSAAPVPSGPACPPEAVQTAQQLGLASQLFQVMKIETNRGTTVWICQDTQGSLYYQGKTGGLSAPLVQRKNGLFLNKVTRTGTDEYEALADNGNLIEVSRETLQVRFTNGTAQTDTVKSAE